jgi:hypothetical protein
MKCVLMKAGLLQVLLLVLAWLLLSLLLLHLPRLLLLLPTFVSTLNSGL